MSNHQAGFAKLGYLYQIRYALYRAIEDTEAYYVKLEALDDVEVKKKDEHELFQLKHHINKDNLNDKSVDLWKTIGIWAEQILKGNVSHEGLKYYLATTSTITENSIASLLTKNGRDEAEALRMLDKAADEIKNKKLLKSISNYLKLSPKQKKVMCESMIIIANEDNSEEIVGKIKNRLELTVQSTFIDSLYEKLEGWWFNNVIAFLLGRKDKLWRNEVVQKVLDLSYEYHPDTLPIDFEDLEMSNNEKEGFLGYQFVKQLELVGVGTERIHNAILDYYRAYNQRTKWVVDDLSIDYDISNYERRLKDDWTRFRLSVIDELEDAEEKEIKKAGRKIFNWVETQADIRIRRKVSQRFIMVGSYHILANKTPPSLGWHPDFVEKLKEIIEPKEIKHAK
ncbi:MULTISPECIES: ABC-three component system protein [Pseudoalteromonas]|uniref:ABC-three component systems C-terminal domain-containing protein n=2 Tax=Pseudoalteromonas TaxID=53246 RepID=A0ABR9FSV8_9GAMM|nr:MULTISPECIES: ABC-three component system protein [Pseudoalteromonas]MBE0459910.1 hypothetical protein [Pseudoalteromonas prydzensis]